MLKLEPLPRVTNRLDKGKEIMYDFSAKMKMSQGPEKLMASTISYETRVLQLGKFISEILTIVDEAETIQSVLLPEGSMGYSAGNYCFRDFFEEN